MNVKKLKLMHPMIQAYRYLHHLQAEILTSLSLIALIFCRQISGYFADYNKDIWFAYFITVERFSMLLLLLSTHSYLKNKCWIILELLLFFLVQDFIDRVFFNIKEWNLNDTVGIDLISLQLIIKTIKNV